jgi:hypothetical protein
MRARSALAPSVSPVRNRRMPRIIQEELDSPGWTRADKATTGRVETAYKTELRGEGS